MRIVLLALVIAATTAIVSTIACGGDEELTLEEFFQQRQAIFDDYDERANALEPDFPESSGDYQAYRVFLGEFAVFLAEFFDELETLNPPSEAEDAFHEFLTAGSEFAEFQEEYGDLAGEAESFTELSQLSHESEAAFSASHERYQAACRSLQEIADANGIVADLECREGLEV